MTNTSGDVAAVEHVRERRNFYYALAAPCQCKLRNHIFGCCCCCCCCCCQSYFRTTSSESSRDISWSSSLYLIVASAARGCEMRVNKLAPCLDLFSIPLASRGKKEKNVAFQRSSASSICSFFPFFNQPAVFICISPSHESPPDFHR